MLFTILLNYVRLVGRSDILPSTRIVDMVLQNVARTIFCSVFSKECYDQTEVFVIFSTIIVGRKTSTSS